MSLHFDFQKCIYFKLFLVKQFYFKQLSLAVSMSKQFYFMQFSLP